MCPQCGRSEVEAKPESKTESARNAETSASGPPPLPAEAPAPVLPPVPQAAPSELPGKPVEATDVRSRLGLESSRQADASPTASPTSDAAFAPYFSLITTLAFGPANANLILQHPSRGSISFGSLGLSIVFDDGRHWEKLLYRDITAIRANAHDDCVLIACGDVESRLTLYHPWLPSWFSKPRRDRSNIFLELFTRVKNGLTPYEISLYRRRLQ
ncbi:MAG: hypothetical protein HY074_10205 [Deltaproteobacteria bacterium]|nr:hypothetical protein [Deltaproteobacteria bacterium]